MKSYIIKDHYPNLSVLLESPYPWRTPIPKFARFDYSHFLQQKLLKEKLTNNEVVVLSLLLFQSDTPQIPRLARNLLQRARAKDVAACYLVAIFCMKGVHPFEKLHSFAYECLCYCLENNLLEARLPLAILLYRGIGTSRNLELAEKHLLQCEKDPIRDRYLALIWIFNKGNDLKKREEGLQLLFENEKNKDPLSSYYLGKLYQVGRKVKQDHKKAFYHYMLGVEVHCQKCAKEAGLMAYNGDGIRQDELQALSYFLRVKDDPTIMYLSACILEKHPTYDQKLRVNLLKRAHELGYYPASLAYGKIIMNDSLDLSVLDSLTKTSLEACQILYSYYKKRKVPEKYRLYKRRMKRLEAKMQSK